MSDILGKWIGEQQVSSRHIDRTDRDYEIGGLKNTGDMTVVGNFATNNFSAIDSTSTMIFSSPVYMSQDSTVTGKFTVDGKLGVGTTNPQEWIDVHSNGFTGIRSKSTSPSGYSYVYVQNDANYFGQISIQGSSETSYAGPNSLNIITNGSNQIISIRQGSNERIRINSDGNIGIGTDYPVTAVHIRAGGLFVDPVLDASTYSLSVLGASNSSKNIFLAGVSGFSNGFSVQYTGSEMKYHFIDGKVGIGTTNPQVTLHLYGINAGTSIRQENSIGKTYEINPFITDSSNSGFEIRDVSDGTSRIIISNIGKIGIGTNNPQYKLSLESSNDQIGWYSDPAHYNNILFYRSSDGAMVFDVMNEAGGGYQFSFASNPIVTILPDGKVGIGTTDPKAQLQITGTDPLTSADGQVIIRGTDISGASDTGASLAFRGHSGTSEKTWGTLQILKEISGNPDRAYFRVNVRSSSAIVTERLRITSAGNVGINTSAPNAMLETWGGNISINSNSNPKLEFRNLDSTLRSSIYRESSSGKFFIRNDEGQPIILDNGNVGIGTANPDVKLDIASPDGRIYLRSVTGTNSVHLRFINDGGLLYIGRERNTGGYFGSGFLPYAGVFDIGGSYPLQLGTNDVARITILPSGNVGIGTTNPTKTLDVNGSVYVNGPNGCIDVPTNIWVYSGGSKAYRNSYFGYSSNYRVLQIGEISGTYGLALGVDLTGNLSGTFTGNEIIVPNNKAVIATNNTNNGYVGILRIGSDNNLYLGGNYSVQGHIRVNSSTGLVTIPGTIQMNIGATINEFSTDGTLADNSDTALPTEKAVKTYVDNAVANENMWDRNGNNMYPYVLGNDIGIGTTNPAAFDPSAKNIVIYKASGNAGLSVITSGSNNGFLFFGRGTGTLAYAGSIGYDHYSQKMAFGVESSTRMELYTSGLKLSTGATINEFSTDTNLTDDSNTAVPTEHAVKAYVDAHSGSGASGWVRSSPYVILHTITDRVGIGTTNPGEKLEVVGNVKVMIDDNQKLLFQTIAGSSPTFQIQTAYSHTNYAPLRFCLQNSGGSGSELYPIYIMGGSSTPGYVGINNTSPSQQLSVTGNTFISGNILGTDAVSQIGGPNNRYNAIWLNSGIDYKNNLNFNYNNTGVTNMVLTTTGTLGIGTGTPTSQFHFYRSSGDSFIKLTSGGNEAAIGTNDSGIFEIGNFLNGGPIVFKTNSGSGATTRFTIASNGNVGFQETPDSTYTIKIVANGIVGASGNITFGGTGITYLGGGTAPNRVAVSNTGRLGIGTAVWPYGQVQLWNSQTGIGTGDAFFSWTANNYIGNTGIIGNESGGTLKIANLLASGSIALQTNSLVRLTIDSDGYVSLGSGVAINEFSTDGTLGDNSDTAVPTERAVRTYVNDHSGMWSRSVPRVYLTDSSDRVGLGTSYPGERLDVVGNIKVMIDDLQKMILERVSGSPPTFRINSANYTNNQYAPFVIGQTNNTGSFVPRIYIRGAGTGAGNVGIGTEAPGEKLEVVGNVKVMIDDNQKLILETVVGTPPHFRLNASYAHTNYAPLIFGQTNSSGLYQPIIYIEGGSTYNGNIGIKITDPTLTTEWASNSIIGFRDGGEIRSYDTRHRILFRRSEDKLELREYGNIILSAGATAGTETNSVIVTSSELITSNAIKFAHSANSYNYGYLSRNGSEIDFTAYYISAYPRINFRSQYAGTNKIRCIIDEYGNFRVLQDGDTLKFGQLVSASGSFWIRTETNLTGKTPILFTQQDALGSAWAGGFDGSQNFGIGTSTPTSQVHLYKATGDAFFKATSGGNEVAIGTNSTGHFEIMNLLNGGNIYIKTNSGSGSTTRVTIGSNGNVGIGISHDSTYTLKLPANGIVGTVGNITFGGTGITYLGGGASPNRVAVSNDGKLGIGTAAWPYGQCQIWNSTTNGDAFFSWTAGNSSANSGIVGNSGTTGTLTLANLLGSGSLELKTGGSARLTINSSGNIGINTVPDTTYVLDVYRGSVGYSARFNAGGYYTSIYNNSTLAQFVTNSARWYFDREIRVDSGLIGSYDEDLQLRTQGTTRMTIVNSGTYTGYVGIGGSPSSQLHIVWPSGDTFIKISSGGNEGLVGINTSGHMEVDNLLNGGSLIFKTNSGSGATTRLTITSSGAATFTSTVTATQFIGPLSGNASSATVSSSCSGNAATATTASNSNALGGLSLSNNTNTSVNCVARTSSSSQGGISIGSSTHRSTNALLSITQTTVDTNSLDIAFSTSTPANATPFVLYDRTNGWNALYVRGTGQMYCRNLTGGQTAVYVDASGFLIRNPSDAKLKTDIKPIENALEKVMLLQGRSFFWTKESNMGDKRDIGLIAQEVEPVVPEVVTKGNDGIMGVNYDNLVALLIEAIKDLKAKNDSLEARLAKLES